MRPPQWPHEDDLEEVRRQLAAYQDSLREARILVTGGTGIIGKWLLACLLHMDRRDALGLRLFVVSRNPGNFLTQYPDLGSDARITWCAGDTRSFSLSPGTVLTHAIHAATDVVSSIEPADLMDTCVRGTAHALRVSRAAGAKRLLLLSSGAVYGTTPPDFGAIEESYVGPLDPLAPDSAYGQGKRCAELLCAIEATQGSMETSIARCFAMVGPFLPLDRHFAIGNFIGAALRGQPIEIRGDGTPVRSYLYMSDVAVRLLLLMLAGRKGVAYNVGGSVPLSIVELAQCIKTALGSPHDIRIGQQPLHGAHAQRYFPDTRRIQEEFALQAEIPLDEAIARTARWHRPG